jgi:hypothetical protein
VASIRRPVVFVAVAVAHVLLLYLLAAYRRPPLVPASLAPASDGAALISLWLPRGESSSVSSSTSEDAMSARVRPTRTRRSSESRSPQEALPAPPSAGEKISSPQWGEPTPPGAPNLPPPNVSPSTSIDWYGEAPSAADRALSAEAQRRRQAAVFAPPPPPRYLARPPPGGYRFGWSEVATQRFRVVNGVPILRINEHCAVAFFILPGCTIGRIAPRGDLFQHTRDPPPEGQEDLP